MAKVNVYKVISISSLSTTYIRATVSATENGTQADPSTGVCYFAFITDSSEPLVSDWTEGSWDTSVLGEHLAQCLIGPSGDATLPDGSYTVWVKVVKGIEEIVSKVGVLNIT